MSETSIADDQLLQDLRSRDDRRHAGLLRFLSDRLRPRLHRRRLAPDLWRVRRHPAVIRHRGTARLDLLGLDGGPRRPAQGDDPHRAELLHRHRRHGLHPGVWLAIPHHLPLLRRHGRHRPLHRRYRHRAGIRAGVQARLGHRPDHGAAAGGHVAGRTVRCLPGAVDRLARLVRRWLAAGGADLADPRVGARVAALADRQGTHRRGPPVARLGAAGRSGDDPTALGRGGRGTRRMARIVQVPAQPDCVLPHRHQPDRYGRAQPVDDHLVRAGAEDFRRARRRIW